jgi:hypothetical protein
LGEAVMNRFLTVFLIFAGLWLVPSAFGFRSLVRNGSFEQTYDIDDELLTYWCDVNTFQNKFQIYLDEAWFTHDVGGPGRSLVIRTKFGVTFQAGDIGTVSQQVYFEKDIEGISFDLDIGTAGSDWNPDKVTALVLVDGEAIWDSDGLPLIIGGFTGTIDLDINDIAQYLGGDMNDVNQFLDDDWHSLSLAVRSNVGGYSPQEYTARWDFVKFNDYCGGLGYLDSDLNQDCFVNLADLAVLGLSWMHEPASIRDDLYEDGIVDKMDLGLFAEDWLYNTDWKKWGQDGTFEMERLENDFDLSGQIDLGDVMVLSEYWLSDGVCAGVELSGDEIINFEDFAVLVNQWGQRDWLYYVE